MADGHGHAFEHRVVVYDRNGGIAGSCFWCGVALVWSTLVVDHLNEVKADNRPENLVVSCNDCNRARGAMTPFLQGLRKEAVEVLVSLVREQANIREKVA
jgi:5-methylcytosine-specific restriction endonuclease McrA